MDKGIDPRETIEQFDDQPDSQTSTITEGVWPGIAGTVIIDDPLNEFAYMLGFPDGSQGLLRKSGGIVLKKGQRAWLKLTDMQGLYEPYGQYDAEGKRIG